MHSSLFQKLAKQYKNGAGYSTPPSQERQKMKRVHKRSSSSPCNEVWFSCIYGGKIMPRSTRKLTYVGGVAKLVLIRYDSTFSDLMKVISEKFEDGLVFHYTPEDIEALVPITDDKSFQDMLDDIKSRPRRKGPKLQGILLPSQSLDAHIVGSINEDPVVLERRYYAVCIETSRIPIHPSSLALIDQLYPSGEEMESKLELHPNTEDNATERMQEG